MRTLLKRFLMWLWCHRIVTDTELTHLIRFFELEDA